MGRRGNPFVKCTHKPAEPRGARPGASPAPSLCATTMCSNAGRGKVPAKAAASPS